MSSQTVAEPQAGPLRRMVGNRSAYFKDTTSDRSRSGLYHSGSPEQISGWLKNEYPAVRRVLQAPSLSRNPMPSRTTRKSDRRKVSDRTMVGTAQPVCLSASGTERCRCDSNMNLCEKETHSVSLHHWGWTANPHWLAVAGEAFVLTSPLIERDSRQLENLRIPHSLSPLPRCCYSAIVILHLEAP